MKHLAAVATAAAALTFSLLAAPASSAVPTASAAPEPRRDPGWGLDRIDQRSPVLDGRFAPRRTGRGVTVYLIDTGLDVTNRQFGARASMARDFVDGVASGGDCGDELGVGHGTFVAGIVGGRRTGVAPRVRLVSLRTLPCTEGTGPTLSSRQQQRLVVRALGWVRRHAVRPAVVNMSLAFHTSNTRVDRAVDRVLAAGIPVVAAAGNFRRDACDYTPARVPGVLTVAAADAQDRSWRSGFSGTNSGPCVDLYAPGRGITSVLAGAGVYRYAGVGATSWAAPFVTGAVALELQRRPHASPERLAARVLGRATTGALTRVPPGTPNRLLHVAHR